MPIIIDGLRGLVRDLDSLQGELEPTALADTLSDPIHDAILESMQAQAGQIPRDTGALRDSLTRHRDRTHVYEVSVQGDAVVVEYGSTLPQAASEHVRPRIPSPSAAAIEAAVAQALDDLLEDEL